MARTITGIIRANGTIKAGEDDFSVVKKGTGVYEVVFKKPFKFIMESGFIIKAVEDDDDTNEILEDLADDLEDDLQDEEDAIKEALEENNSLREFAGDFSAPRSIPEGENAWVVYGDVSKMRYFTLVANEGGMQLKDLPVSIIIIGTDD